MATNNSVNEPTAASGKVLQGQGVGTASAFSTATYPATATGTGKILRADGTNFVVTTATFPDTAGTSGNVLTSDGTNWSSSTPSSGSLTWNTVSGTSQAASINNGYITNNAGLVTVTLPSSAAVGSIVEVAGKGAGGWKIAQNAGQLIHMDGVDSTTGTGGSLSSSVQYDAVRLLCITTDTDWVVLSGIGNLTVV